MVVHGIPHGGDQSCGGDVCPQSDVAQRNKLKEEQKALDDAKAKAAAGKGPIGRGFSHRLAIRLLFGIMFIQQANDGVTNVFKF